MNGEGGLDVIGTETGRHAIAGHGSRQPCATSLAIVLVMLLAGLGCVTPSARTAALEQAAPPASQADEGAPTVSPSLEASAPSLAEAALVEAVPPGAATAEAPVPAAPRRSAQPEPADEANRAARMPEPPPAAAPPLPAGTAQNVARARLAADLAALQEFRPSYPFWQHIFTVPDGHIAFGSREDGRLLATFPARGNWQRAGVWEDPALARAVAGRPLPRRLSDRRDALAERLEPLVGPVVHNATRGRFLAPHAQRYGPFLREWGDIYERFGVPAEIGLAQALVESGLNGRARSPVRALGFCQWMPRNWNRLKRLSPYVIEGYNQTTQAPFCAAYLTILATMYGSFLPALSEHHAGGVNVGRVVINGERLGGADEREQYLMGSDFVRELRQVSIRRYRHLFRTYGPRSALYAEMVFGNALNVTRLMDEMPQAPIFAMRAPRSLPLSEVMAKSGLSRDDVRRYNPALVRRVPARAHVYLPEYVPEFGPDVSFWHRPAPAEYAAVLNEFVRLDVPVERWHEAGFEPTIRDFRSRFEATNSEEGTIMASVLGYVLQELRASLRPAILDEFRDSDRIRRLFDRGRRELAAGGGS